MHITPALLNKIMDSIEDFCNKCIKNKHTRIIKHKAITRIIQRVEEIHNDFWGPYDPSSISEKSYIGLLLNKYIQKSWVPLLRSKSEFFNAFK